MGDGIVCVGERGGMVSFQCTGYLIIVSFISVSHLSIINKYLNEQGKKKKNGCAQRVADSNKINVNKFWWIFQLYCF